MKKVEIPVRNLFTALLKRWWLILLCACACAALVFVQAKKADQSALDAYHQEAAEFQKRVAEHQKKIEELKENYEYVNGLSEVDTAISVQADEAIPKSLLLKLDPMRLEAACLYVQAEGAKASQALDLVLLSGKTLSLREALGDSYPEGVEEWALRELLSLEREGDLVRIACLVPDDDRVNAEAIVKKVYAALAMQQEKDAPAWGTLSLVKTSVGPMDGTNLIKQKREIIDNARTARDRKNDMASQASNAKQSWKNLSNNAPKMSDEPVSQAKKKIVQGAVMGAALGVLLSIALYFVVLPLQEGPELQRMLGLPFFGALGQKDGYALCLANTEQAAKGKRTILLTGSGLTLDEGEKIAAKLNEMQDALHFTAAENVERSADAVRALSDAEGVVLVEKVNRSALRKVYSQMERLNRSDAKVLGYFVF